MPLSTGQCRQVCHFEETSVTVRTILSCGCLKCRSSLYAAMPIWQVWHT